MIVWEKIFQGVTGHFKFVIYIVFRDLGKWNLSDKTTVTEFANSYT